jgi:hypothetical protein
MRKVFGFVCCLIFCVSNVWAYVKVDAYLSSICTHCQHLQAVLNEYQSTHPWLIVNYRFIDTDKVALVEFSKALEKSGDPLGFSVPTLFFCDARWVGFDDAETLKAPLLNALQMCQTLNTMTTPSIDMRTSMLALFPVIEPKPISFYEQNQYFLLGLAIFSLAFIVYIIMLRK